VRYATVVLGLVVGLACPLRAAERPTQVARMSMPDRVYMILRRSIEAYPFDGRLKAEHREKNLAALERLREGPWLDLGKLQRVRVYYHSNLYNKDCTATVWRVPLPASRRPTHFRANVASRRSAVNVSGGNRRLAVKVPLRSGGTVHSIGSFHRHVRLSSVSTLPVESEIAIVTVGYQYGPRTLVKRSSGRRTAGPRRPCRRPTPQRSTAVRPPGPGAHRTPRPVGCARPWRDRSG